MRLFKRLFSLKANLGSLFSGGGNAVQNLAAPSYYNNPTYTQSTQNLANLSSQILSGNLPSYYSSLGNPNSQQFQALQSNLIGQTNQASQQQSAASGTDRSGVAATAAASSLANTLPGLDYSNLLNAQSQQQGLLQLGSGIEGMVNQSSLAQQENQNAFNQTGFEDQMQMAQYNNSYNQMMSQQMGQLFGNVLGGGIGAGVAGLGGGNSAQILSGFGQGAGFGNMSNLFNSSAGGGAGAGGAMGLGGAPYSFAGTSGIDAILQSGAPLALAAA